jgi:sugar O-acyltransferase (sialic acid O-acetyltransferase NeuD family)
MLTATLPPLHPLQASRPGQRVVVVGAGEQGELAYEYLTHDSPHEVVGFAVEAEFLTADRLCGLPIIALEEIAEQFPPDEYRTLVAVSSTHLNRLRSRLYGHVKSLGYDCISFVSSRAFVWHNVQIGENTFVFEDNVLQHRVRLGDNVILWSGSHVGHQTVIETDCFVAPRAAISGFCKIGRGSYLGVNCCLADNLVIAEDCVIGAGAVVVKPTEAGQVYVGNPARPTGRSSLGTFGVPGR